MAATAAGNCWAKLSEDIKANRATAPGQDKVRNYLLSALKTLAERGYCSKTVEGWVKCEKKKDGERAPKGIRAYSLGLEGKLKPSGLSWYARIDLTEEPEGKGLCAHPLLHCHMGSQPDAPGTPAEADALTNAAAHSKQRVRAFSPRVPLPWLSPWEAVQWLLATADPSLEPVARASGGDSG